MAELLNYQFKLRTVASTVLLWKHPQPRGDDTGTFSMHALIWFRKRVDTADADLWREMITSFVGAPNALPAMGFTDDLAGTG